ncbi:hypothetical protein BSKO_04112 [Bryopsis sp. KO-2023]|nr:hypothetical protein BSKO_04112 [Bryopsis sp. KO-2023]
MLPFRGAFARGVRSLAGCDVSVGSALEKRLFGEDSTLADARRYASEGAPSSGVPDTSEYLRSMFDLSGNVAFVSGCSRGIGRQTCLALARAGADVMVTDHSEKERGMCETLVDEIQALGRRSASAVCDVRYQDSVTEALQHCKEELGLVSIMCANAGIFGNTRQPEDLNEDDWRNIFATNTDGVFYCCRAAFPHFRERNRGKVVIMSSVASMIGHGRLPAFSSSKGALIPLAKALATSWARYNIQVNCVLPGVVETEVASPFLDFNNNKQQPDSDKIPAGRLAKPEDLQGAILYFASSASDYCTGAQLVVDGGLSSNAFGG